MDLVKKLANSNTFNSFIAKHQDPAYQSPGSHQQYGAPPPTYGAPIPQQYGQPPQQHQYGYSQQEQQQQQQQQQYPRPPSDYQQHGTHLSANYAVQQPHNQHQPQQYQHQQQSPYLSSSPTNYPHSPAHSPRPSPSHSPRPYNGNYGVRPPHLQPYPQQQYQQPANTNNFKTLHPNWQNSKELHLSPSPSQPPLYIIKYSSSTSTHPGLEILSPLSFPNPASPPQLIGKISYHSFTTTKTSVSLLRGNSNQTHQLHKSFTSLTGLPSPLKWSNEHSHLTLYYQGPGSGARSLDDDDDLWGGIESCGGGGKTDHHKGVPMVRMTVEGGGDGSTKSTKRQGARVEVLAPPSSSAGAGGQWRGELVDARQWDEVICTGFAVLDGKRKEMAEAKIAIKIMNGGLG